MTPLNAPAMQRAFEWRLRGESKAAVNRAGRPTLVIVVMVAMMICAWPGSKTFAAGQPEGVRSVPGSVVPSTGTTADYGASPKMQPSLPSSSNAGLLGAPGQGNARCANLRKRYAQSEACFARYRMKNHGLRSGAFQHCKQLEDPSVECGLAAAP